MARTGVYAAVAGLLVLAVTAGGGLAATRDSGASAQDANYLQASISGDRFEIIGGKLAQKKGATQQVKALGARLVKDHSKSLSEAISEAKKANVKVPAAPTPSEVWELQTVGSMSGSAFDRAYTSLEVKDHQQDIEETTFEVGHGQSADIQAGAKKELPMLRMHLSLSKKAMSAG
jgi:putative membrane protein